MKKITLLLFSCLILTGLNAQIVYQTILTDNFENTDGFPANFSCKAQQVWITVNATNNPYPYTGAIWRDVFFGVKPASKKHILHLSLPKIGLEEQVHNA